MNHRSSMADLTLDTVLYLGLLLLGGIVLIGSSSSDTPGDFALTCAPSPAAGVPAAQVARRQAQDRAPEFSDIVVTMDSRAV